MSLLSEARAKLLQQLNWRGPNGKTQGVITLTRAEAEAVLAGLTEPIAVLDENLLLCDCSSSDCNGGAHGYCHCEREKRLVLTPRP